MKTAMSDPKTKPNNLQTVSGLVPPPVKSLIKRLAEQEGRTESQILRRLLERVPEVKAAIRQAKAA